jgi:AcrR family transcriptional regulator
MTKSISTKWAMLEAMAAHVLANGLNTASLRPLAKAAGTSDRMLLYHFDSKERLIGELLLFLAAQLAETLDGALPSLRAASVRACIAEIVALLRQEPFRGYMRLWLEIVSAAGQGSPNHASAGSRVIAGYLDWLEKRLPEGTPDARRTACLMLTFLEGTLVMDAVGQSEVAAVGLAMLFPE